MTEAFDARLITPVIFEPVIHNGTSHGTRTAVGIPLLHLGVISQLSKTIDGKEVIFCEVSNSVTGSVYTVDLNIHQVNDVIRRVMKSIGINN